MESHASVIGIAVVALWATVACPQLRDDDFKPRLMDVGGGGTTAGGGRDSDDGGRSGCNTGSGSCALDGGAGGAGTGTAGQAGSSGRPGADSGTEPDPTGANCGPDEVAQNGTCYFADSAARTWAEARTSCQARGDGWDLVTIGDVTQNDLAVSITGFEAWIGATDAVVEGSWSWVNEEAPFFEVDVTPTTFANWSDGEPNDYDDSDCLRILTTGQWADWPCDSPLGYVCSRRAP